MAEPFDFHLFKFSRSKDEIARGDFVAKGFADLRDAKRNFHSHRVDDIHEVEKNVFKESSRINSTFGGNLVDMYRFKLILEIIKKENLLKNATQMGKYLLKNINSLSEEFPGYVTNPRGVGLFCAFDMTSGMERDKLINFLFDNKLLILGSGDKSIRFRPHLNVTQKEIDIAIDIIFNTLKKMLN